jgi:hypothetical protein
MTTQSSTHYSGPVTPEARARVNELLAGLTPSFGVLRERLARAIVEPVGAPIPARDAVWTVVATPRLTITGFVPAGLFSRPLDDSDVWDRALREQPAAQVMQRFFDVLPLLYTMTSCVPAAVIADLVRVSFPAGDFFHKPVDVASRAGLVGVFVLHDGAADAALAYQSIGTAGVATQASGAA